MTCVLIIFMYEQKLDLRQRMALTLRNWCIDEVRVPWSMTKERIALPLVT